MLEKNLHMKVLHSEGAELAGDVRFLERYSVIFLFNMSFEFTTLGQRLNSNYL